MRPNWFFGFPIDGRFIDQLPPAPPTFRVFHSEDVHLTLAFLGGCGENAAYRALDALDAQLAQRSLDAVDVSLGQVVPMGGSRKHYTALSALLDEGRETLTEYLGALRNPLLLAATRRSEQRPPKPHVTLARPRRRATDAQRRAGLEWATGLDLSAVRTRVARIALYTWSEDRQARLFKVVTERWLAPP